MPCFIDMDICRGAAFLAPSAAIKHMPGVAFRRPPEQQRRIEGL